MADENKMEILFGADGRPLTKTLHELEKDLKDFGDKLKTAIDPRVINDLNKQLELTKKNIGLLKNFSIGPNTSGLQKGTQTVFAFNQLLREMPAFAFSAQTGILALSNNIPIFMDRLKEARAGGASFGTIFKDLGKSLLTFPSILTIGVAALTIFGDKIFNTGKKAKEAADEYETFLKSIRGSAAIKGDAAGSVQGQIAQMRALTAAVLDQTKSEIERGRALQQLKGINKEYFGDLTLATATMPKLTALTNEYTQALVQQAVVKGFLDEISKIAPELAKQQRAVEKLQTAFGVALSTAAQGRQPGDVVTEDNVNLTMVKREEAARKAGDALAEQQQRVLDLQKTYRTLEGDINTATLATLKFKPLEGFNEPKAKLDKVGLSLSQLFAVIRSKQSDEFLKLDESVEKGIDKYYDTVLKAMADGLAKTGNIIDNQLNKSFEPTTSVNTDGSGSTTVQLEKQFKLMSQIRALGGIPVDVSYLSNISAGNLILEEQLKKMGLVIDKHVALGNVIAQNLQPALNTFYDTLLSGSESPFEAIKKALIGLVKQLVVTIATAATLALILQAMGLGGGASFGTLFKSFLGGGGIGDALKGTGGSSPGAANPSLNGGMLGQAMQVNVVGQIEGRNIKLIMARQNESDSKFF